eukprot:Phypoly_transcript_01765.p1 GENE.Phypoly_transcript_01765~~Phypoly_transcript_01765.p1  ORF type:complete len:1002 (+),score=110.49 Phypoly_transcript_01765:82-3087(+)
MATLGRTLYLPKIQRVNIIATQTASPKINPYTVYVAEVKMAGLNVHTIIRRYSEFMDLHEKLQAKYPTVKLYFPPKKAFGKLRADVINQRKDQLQAFLQTLVDHPKLSTDYTVYSFLSPHLFPVKEKVPVAVSLITLPNEIFLKCLLMISFKDVLALTQVCSHLYQFITTHPTLWLYLNSRFDPTVTGTTRHSGLLPSLAASKASKRSSDFFHSSAGIGIPLSGGESPSSSPQSSSAGSFEVFSLDNPNVSALNLSSELILPSLDDVEEGESDRAVLSRSSPSLPPQRLRKTESLKNVRGSHMLRPHAVPAFHRSPSLTPTEYVYLGADESEFRRIFLENVREFHKLRISVARENKACDCVLRKLVGTIVGDTGVGKTRILQSCLTSFSPSLVPQWSNDTESTSSNGNSGNTPSAVRDSHTECHVTHIVTNGKFLCFQLFDSTGAYNDTIRHQHLSQSNFVIITFSVVDRASYLHVREKWIPEVREFSPEVPIIVVGLKRDLREDPSNSYTKPVQFQEAMETFYKLGAIHYAESPSPSSGVGGWRTDFRSWRVNLLSEVGSLILFNVNPHTKPAKSAYEEKLAFLHRLFPFKQIESIGVALASCVGDIDQAVEFLVNQGPASPPAPVPPVLVLPTTSFVAAGIKEEAKNDLRSSSEGVKGEDSPSSESEAWRVELRQSWKMEISRMEGSLRSHFINESVEAGLVVSNTWDEDTPTPTPPPVKKEIDATASTALKAQRAVYLEKLKKTSIDRFIKDFLKRKIPPKQQAEMTVSFLGEISSYVSSHTLWEDEDEKELVSMREDLERYVFSKIYKSVFSVNPADITKDQFFRERISKLVFITPSHLDINEKFWNTDLWDAATYEINLMDQQKTPSDKLTCILNCCKVIIFLLTTSGDSQAGADDFLPHLIYVLIKANPKNLASNMEFITSYCGPDVMRMEKYYYFTTLSVGVSFIENIDASSLNIDPVAFEKYASLSPSLCCSPTSFPPFLCLIIYVRLMNDNT